MIILGVDPGTKFTGYGIVQYVNNELAYVSSGVIKPSVNLNIADKLNKIYNELQKIITLYKPDEFSLETAFYGKNIQSTLKIGYVRGVSLLISAHNKLDTAEYSPREIKKAVVGNGAASKEQVQFMINKLLRLEEENMKFDESDALAVAVCHAFKRGSRQSKSSSWASYVSANPDKIIE
ncbi:crossover junction endodeoxyribonuclease RuvC [bacterium BMS3Abin04]|nr:crossover junction endodeoxyribonuclease RuvC [bacterium BMS3Abin04]